LQEKNIKHSGNISMDDVIEIARVMSDRSCARDLSGTIKEILGTCVSVGCTVDHEEPRDLQQKVRSWTGLYEHASPASGCSRLERRGLAPSAAARERAGPCAGRPDAMVFCSVNDAARCLQALYIHVRELVRKLLTSQPLDVHMC